MVSCVQEIALAVSLAYLIYDLFCCLFDKRISVDNAVHHLVSIIGIGAGLLYGKVTDTSLLANCQLVDSIQLSEWSKAILAVCFSRNRWELNPEIASCAEWELGNWRERRKQGKVYWKTSFFF